jgi:hypothetical protein
VQGRVGLSKEGKVLVLAQSHTRTQLWTALHLHNSSAVAAVRQETHSEGFKLCDDA